MKRTRFGAPRPWALDPRKKKLSVMDIVAAVCAVSPDACLEGHIDIDMKTGAVTCRCGSFLCPFCTPLREARS